MEVLSALNSSAVSRMRRTFESIDKPTLVKFDKVRAIMSHDRNYRTYRRTIAALPRGAAAVPYVGIFLTDLRFIMDGQPSTITEDGFGFSQPLINWQKFAKATECISLLHQFQADSSYIGIRPVTDLQCWVLSRNFATADQCYLMSCRVDPQDYEKLVEEFMLREAALVSRLRRLEKAVTIPMEASLRSNYVISASTSVPPGSVFSLEDTL